MPLLRFIQRLFRKPETPPPVTLADMRKAKYLYSDAERQRKRLRQQLDVFDERMEGLIRVTGGTETMMETLILFLAFIGVIGLVPFIIQLVRLRIALGRHSQSIATILFDCVIYSVSLVLLIGTAGTMRRVLDLPETPPKATLILVVLFAPFPWIFLARLWHWKERLGTDPEAMS